MTKSEILKVVEELTKELRDIVSFTREEQVMLRPQELESIERKIELGERALGKRVQGSWPWPGRRVA